MRRLLAMLVRFDIGERRVWSVLRVPTRFLRCRILDLDKERRERLRTATGKPWDQVRQLAWLRGMGDRSSWLFVMEFLGWREFRNRREVGSLAGLTPAPFPSGETHREQGIHKAGNRRVRHMAIEIAWGWLRYQPRSALSRWYRRRFARAGPRARKAGIVALARRLFVDLWRYRETGAVAPGVARKP